MSGREIQKQIIEMGLTDAEFCRAADISPPTLKKIYSGEFVRERTLNKARRALERLKEQRGKTAAVAAV
jgi:predicted transcriptional regulator